MDFILDGNDYSDEDEPELAEMPDWFIEEELYYSKLTSVNKFKIFISSEPEFYAITQLSDAKLLNCIETKKTCNKTKLTEYQYELFDDIYETLHGVKSSKNHYNKIAAEIFKLCYI